MGGGLCAGQCWMGAKFRNSRCDISGKLMLYRHIKPFFKHFTPNLNLSLRHLYLLMGLLDNGERPELSKKRGGDDVSVHI